jgi:cobalt-zinc-cadmium efflux system protein
MAHIHHHSHAHDHEHHAHEPQDFTLAFALSISLNLIFSFFQAGYAMYANSMSLLADAVHNFGDVLGLVLAWGASWLLTRPASERYSYGYRRTTILAALSNALILVGTSALIIYEAIIKLFNPGVIQENVVIIVAMIGILINGGTALLFIKGQKEDLNIKGAFLHLATDMLISLGVVVVAIAILYTGLYWLDPVVSLLIVAIILLNTWGLLKGSVDMLLDAVPQKINRTKVEAYLLSLPGVSQIHDLHIWALSTKEVALTAHLVMPDAYLDDEEYQQISHTLKHDYLIQHVTLQVEKTSTEKQCAHGNACA